MRRGYGANLTELLPCWLIGGWLSARNISHVHRPSGCRAENLCEAAGSHHPTTPSMAQTTAADVAMTAFPPLLPAFAQLKGDHWKAATSASLAGAEPISGTYGGWFIKELSGSGAVMDPYRPRYRPARSWPTPPCAQVCCEADNNLLR